MMAYHFSKIVGLLCVVFVLQVYGDVTDTEYALMPSVFHMDDFDQCMVLGEEMLYCFVTTELRPTNPKQPSQVWKIIEKVISSAKNYRHDKLRHGICVPLSCPNLAGNITFFKTNQKLLQKELSSCYTEKYSKLGLESLVTRMHCETQEPFYNIDSFDIFVAICLFILFAVVVLGSFYEGCARYKSKEEYDKITNTT
ncbi:hypothetical protein ILUMI_17219, partial [Ignelater luminosus]